MIDRLGHASITLPEADENAIDDLTKIRSNKKKPLRKTAGHENPPAQTAHFTTVPKV